MRRTHGNRAQLSVVMLCVLWADIRGCRPSRSTTSRRKSHKSSRYVSTQQLPAWKTWAGVRRQ